MREGEDFGIPIVDFFQPMGVLVGVGDFETVYVAVHERGKIREIYSFGDLGAEITALCRVFDRSHENRFGKLGVFRTDSCGIRVNPDSSL